MYENYTFTSMPATAQINFTTNGSFNDCQSLCGNSCAGFSYSFTNKNCSVINLNEGHGHLIYTIEPVKDFVWHGVRNGTNGEIQIYSPFSKIRFSSYFFDYNTGIFLLKKSKKSRSVLQDSSRPLRLYWKKKNCHIAEL